MSGLRHKPGNIHYIPHSSLTIAIQKVQAAVGINQNEQKQNPSKLIAKNHLKKTPNPLQSCPVVRMANLEPGSLVRKVLGSLVMFDMSPCRPSWRSVFAIIFLQNWPRRNWLFLNTCNTIKSSQHYTVFHNKRPKKLS